MTKNVLSVLLIICSHFIVFAQSADFDRALSKAHVKRADKDSAQIFALQAFELAKSGGSDNDKLKALTYVGISFVNQNKLDTAYTLLTDMIAQMGDATFQKGMAYWYLGKLHQRKADYELSDQNYHLGKEIFEQYDSAIFVCRMMTSLGVNQGIQGNFSAALDWFIASYEYKLKNGFEKNTDVDLHNIANVYMRQGSYDKAITYYRKSIALADGISDYSPYIGIGGAYNLQLMTDSALYYYSKAFEMAQKEGAERGQISAAINLSNIYYQTKKYRMAISYLETVLQSSAMPARSVPSTLVELGKNYYGLELYDSAEYYLRKGEQEAVKVNNRQYIAESAEYLSTVLADQKKFEEAYKYASLSIAHADSVTRERRDDAITDQRIKLETLKKQHEIDALNAENQVNQYKLISLVVGGVSLALIALLAFLNFKSRAHLKQVKLEEEKAVLQVELEKRQAQLSAHTLHMIHHKNGIEEIEQQLTDLDGVGKQKIKNIISLNKAQEKDWDNFNNYFSDVHAQFFDILKSHHQDLTQSEIRLCALLRMNLANGEIATLLNIEPKSVKMARYRLKKKLQLEEEQDLNSYISELEIPNSNIAKN
ncbi:tetratricopeptide repeat protein [Reichenbachiella sp.]|uniref:tetratricopeptide repeat protein n=1 Tax=Reichenbachiella sp. TaxID=2184521 RepID=UPI003BAF8670